MVGRADSFEAYYSQMAKIPVVFGSIQGFLFNDYAMRRAYVFPVVGGRSNACCALHADFAPSIYEINIAFRPMSVIPGTCSFGVLTLQVLGIIRKTVGNCGYRKG